MQNFSIFTLCKSILKLTFTALPPVTNIDFSVNSSCANNNYLNTRFSINNLSAFAANSFIKGQATVNNLKEMLVDANLQSAINLGDIKNIYPVKQLTNLSGNLKINVTAKGKYNPAKKSFPVTKTDLVLQNGIIQTVYYPHPVSDIEVAATITNSTGNIKRHICKYKACFFSV